MEQIETRIPEGFLLLRNLDDELGVAHLLIELFLLSGRTARDTRFA